MDNNGYNGSPQPTGSFVPPPELQQTVSFVPPVQPQQQGSFVPPAGPQQTTSFVPPVQPQQQGPVIPPQQPPQPYGGYQEPTPDPKKPKKKGVTILLIILIVLLLAAIAGIVCWSMGLFKKNVTIFFDTDGGDKIETMTVKAGEEVILPDATRKDYNFDGWTLDGKKVSSPFTTDEDVLLKAKWSLIKITVTFYSDVGLPTVDVEMLPGDKLSYPAKEDLPVIEGYTVIGWSDLDGKEVPEGTKIYEDTTLVPILSMNVFCVSFDPDGGTPVPAIFINEGEPFHAPTPPTKSGYTFVCWVDKNGNPVYDGALLAMEDIMLKATWQKKAYTITFDSDGGSAVSPITFYAGEKIKLPSPPTKSGYSFVCWVDKNGTPIYDGALLTEGNVTLKATWQKKGYTITFDSTGGSAVSPITFYEGEPIKLPPAPTKSGSEFVCWGDKWGNPIYDGALLAGGDVTLYAQWHPTQFTISFDSKGGSAVSPVTIKEGASVTLPPAPTRSGYRFNHWEDQNGMPILDGAKLVCEDITLYAVWDKVYTITFDSDGGSYVAPIEFIDGDTFKEPPQPTIDSNAIFITWVDPDGHPVHNGDLLDPKDMVFTAIWN